MKPAKFEKRNSSSKAAKLLLKKSKISGIPVGIVKALYDMCFDLDDECISWISIDEIGPIPSKVCKAVSEYFEWPRTKVVKKDEIVSYVIDGVNEKGLNHFATYLKSVKEKNVWGLSHFVSTVYNKNISSENYHYNKIPETIGFVNFCGYAFRKIFRGGCMEHDDLGYVYMDNFTSRYEENIPVNMGSWLIPLVDSFSKLPAKFKLSDLIMCCKGILPGDKYFKQNIIESLAYIGILQTDEHNPEKDFIPMKRDV